MKFLLKSGIKEGEVTHEVPAAIVTPAEPVIDFGDSKLGLQADQKVVEEATKEEAAPIFVN